MPLTGDRKREYDVVYRAKRRQEWVESQGSLCATCGSADGPFDVDHIDPTTKKYVIATLWTRRKETRDAELAKCQLLCEDCHIKKTSSESKVYPEHGSHAKGYARGCKCESCMEAMRIHWREYRASKK